MNRRDFLRYIIATSAASYLDPEKLLWIPGEKKIFIPSGKKFGLIDLYEAELTRFAGGVKNLFNRDEQFYAALFSPGFAKDGTPDFHHPLDYRTPKGRPVEQISSEDKQFNIIFQGINDE